MQFPKLANGGGYELLRLGDMKTLEIISEPASGYSVEYLKSVVSSAKIYIRPLQKNLDTDENVSKTSPILILQLFIFIQELIGDSNVTETCLVCGDVLPMNTIKSHLRAHRYSSSGASVSQQARKSPITSTATHTIITSSYVISPAMAGEITTVASVTPTHSSSDYSPVVHAPNLVNDPTVIKDVSIIICSMQCL